MMLKTAAQERNKRLKKMARDAITQYNADMAAGGEPLFPSWTLELLGMIADYDRMVATLVKQRLHLVDIVDFESKMVTPTVVQIRAVAS